MNPELLSIIERCVKLKKYLWGHKDYDTVFNFVLRNKYDAEISIDLKNKKYIMTYWYEDMYAKNFYLSHVKELSELEAIEIMFLVEEHLRNKSIDKIKKEELEKLAKERCELEMKLDVALSRIT